MSNKGLLEPVDSGKACCLFNYTVSVHSSDVPDTVPIATEGVQQSLLR